MSRMERVKNALTSTINKLRDQIETSHKTGKIPADYSLGFANGLIFADHHIQMRDGKPTFYERTTSIGTLPKPVALNSGNALRDEQSYQFLQDATILRARMAIDAIQINHETKTVDVTEKTLAALLHLRDAVEQMDKFVSEAMEAKELANESSQQETTKEQQED